MKGPRGIAFVEFVEFFAFIGLMKQGRVEDCIPLAESNTINTTNTINKHAGFEGS